MNAEEKKWLETNNQVCAILRQLHDALALSSLPPKRKWVGLTDEDLEKTCGFGEYTVTSTRITLTHLAKAIEAKLKEKNT